MPRQREHSTTTVAAAIAPVVAAATVAATSAATGVPATAVLWNPRA